MPINENTNLAKLDAIIERLLSDSLTGNLRVIDTIHSKIHLSELFVMSHRFEGIANNADIEVLFKTSVNLSTHAIAKITTSGDAYVDLYENTIPTGDGTPIPEINKNRYGVDTAGFTASYTPTLSADGDSLLNEMIIGGSGGLKIGGTSGDRDEFVLKEDTYYLIRVTNKAGTAADIGVFISAYEPSGS